LKITTLFSVLNCNRLFKYYSFKHSGISGSPRKKKELNCENKNEVTKMESVHTIVLTLKLLTKVFIISSLFLKRL